MGEVQYEHVFPLPPGPYMCEGQVTHAVDAVLPVVAVHSPDEA